MIEIYMNEWLTILAICLLTFPLAIFIHRRKLHSHECDSLGRMRWQPAVSRNRLQAFLLVLTIVVATINLSFDSAGKNKQLNYAEDREVDFVIPQTVHREKKAQPIPPPQNKIDFTVDEVVDFDIDDRPELIDTFVAAVENIMDTATAEVVTKAPLVLPSPEEDVPMIRAEIMPYLESCNEDGSPAEKYKCTKEKILKIMYESVDYPSVARDQGITGTVVMQFVIDKNGEIKNIKLLRDIGGGCGDEVMKVFRNHIESNEVWRPGRQGIHAVSVLMTIPVRFELR